MREVTTTEAKARFAELLREVEYGKFDSHHPPREDGRATDSGG